VFGIEFLSPLFAAGLLAAGIPLVIHMIHRRQARVLPIATLRFLRQIPARTIRRRQLEEYLLLAARMLVLILLALAAMRPVLSDAAASGGATSLAVVLDDSWSMEYRVTGITRFQEAQEAVIKVLGTLEPGDRAALLPASSPGGETLTSDLAGLRRRVGSMEVSLLASARGREKRFPGLLPACLKALTLLREAKTANRELVLVTDLQRRAVAPLLDEIRLTEEDRDLRVLLVDLGADDPANVSVTDVTAGAGVAVAGEPVRVTARIRNSSATGSACRLSLAIGEERVAERAVSLGAGESASVSIVTATDLPEATWGRVFLNGDDLARDDLRHFALPVLGRIPVLLVNGDPSPIPYQDEAFFLRAALSPEDLGGMAGAGSVNLTVVTDEEFEDEALAPYRAVVLANVAALSARAAGSLKGYVLAGGGLVVFCGNRMRPDDWNRDLAIGGNGILPAMLSPPRQLGDGPEALARLADARHDHALFAGLPPESVKDLARIHVRRAMGADVEAVGGTSIADLDSGGTLVAEKTPGRGRVILFTTSADADWGNLPIRPLFLPLVHRAVRLVAGGGDATRSVPVGGRVVVAPPPANAPPPEAISPSGEMSRIVPDSEGIGPLTTGPLLEPGVWRITGSGAGEEIAVAVNVDPDEGVLDRLGADKLRDRLGEDRFRVIRGAAGLAPELSRSRRGRPLWGAILLAALLLLLTEGWFSNRIARARAAKDRETAP